MMVDLYDMFNELDRQTDDHEINKIVRAPFGYIGSKRKSLKNILPKLPYCDCYIEPFGGSGVVLINRRPSKFEVFNDRYAGVVAFYRCIKDEKKLQAMCEWLEHTVMSREDFYWCHDTWQDCEDDVERAARWFYMFSHSFGNKGTTWGRTIGGDSNKAGMIRRKLPAFLELHERFKGVMIENCDWSRILKDYDNPQAVFYLDPPYVDTYSNYTHVMSIDEHRSMLNMVMDMKGFVAVSGYPNALYDSYKWDDRISWEVACTLTGNSNTGLGANNNKGHLQGLEKQSIVTEALWIKETQ